MFGQLWHANAEELTQSQTGSNGQSHLVSGLEPEVLINCILCVYVCSVAQSYLTLCDAMDFIPPGFSAHGISQARMLEQVSISFSTGSS